MCQRHNYQQFCLTRNIQIDCIKKDVKTIKKTKNLRNVSYLRRIHFTIQILSRIGHCVLHAFNLSTYKMLKLSMILLYILSLEIKQDYFSFFCKEQRVSESSLSSSISKGLLRYFGTTCYQEGSLSRRMRNSSCPYDTYKL